MMTLDIAREATCVRLPVDSDPGVWKCQTPQDTDCFEFGGYTSGGVPELMAIDAPVARTAIEEIEQAAGRARVISRAGPGNPWYRA